MINTNIGKYKITRLIGEGGMASVYEAEHEMLGTKVAIKVLNPILSANAQIKERFRNEAKLMASLDHPNITKVIDFDEQPQQLSIVMEFLNGEDLNDKIKRNGPLSEKEITDVFSQTLSAFQYAHEKGIVHRDIKPSNIFILPNGHVKIFDFGIAKLFGQGNEMTQTGTQMGTPIYMSPEQVKADKSIDHRSDIYSLGVTLYYTLNGKPPYDANTSSQYDIFNKIVLEPLPELTGTGYLNELIKKACSKDRNLRFQYCKEWIDDLNNKEVSTTQTVDKTIVDAPASDKTILETTSAPMANKTVVKTASHDADKTTGEIQSKLVDKPITKSGSSATETTKKSKNNKVLLFSILGVFAIALIIGGVLFFVASTEAGSDEAEKKDSESYSKNDSIDKLTGDKQDSVTFLKADKNLNQEKVKVIQDEIEWVDSLNGYFTDTRDNNKYKVVKIGSQIWMAENLKFKIQNGCYSYKFDDSYVSSFGYYYDMSVINRIAPKGWHLPNVGEIRQLVSYINKTQSDPVASVLDGGITRLNVKLIGYLEDNKTDFNGFGGWTHFWSSKASNNNRYYLSISASNPREIYLNSDAGFQSSFAVRCLKD